MLNRVQMQNLIFGARVQKVHTNCTRSAGKVQNLGINHCTQIAHEWPHFLSYRQANGASKSAGATPTVPVRSPPSDKQGIGQ